MPELLPCPLSLSRYNPSFAKQDSKKDFADIDLDPDYNTLADFRKMMADLNVWDSELQFSSDDNTFTYIFSWTSRTPIFYMDYSGRSK